MTILIIGNMIGLVASILMVYSGILKKKNKILYIQTIQIGLSVFSNILLGGFPGAIINTICLVRNILYYKKKLTFKVKLVITILSILLTLEFNNLGLIGLLPLLSTVIYLWLMNIKNIKKFKLLIIFTSYLWFIYDFVIRLYTAALFDLMNMIVNLISMFEIKIKKI